MWGLMNTPELPLASWARRLVPSAIQDMLQNITKPGVFSLALGAGLYLAATSPFFRAGAPQVSGNARIPAEEIGAVVSPTRGTKPTTAFTNNGEPGGQSTGVDSQREDLMMG